MPVRVHAMSLCNIHDRVENRRSRADLIEIFRTAKKSRHMCPATARNCRTSVHCFSQQLWNSLSQEHIDAPFLSCFKNRLEERDRSGGLYQRQLVHITSPPVFERKRSREMCLVNT